MRERGIIPVIFLSAVTETEDKVKAFSSGGVDFIGKPFQVPEVLARVRDAFVVEPDETRA